MDSVYETDREDMVAAAGLNADRGGRKQRGPAGQVGRWEYFID